jgi:hypothetical protein
MTDGDIQKDPATPEPDRLAPSEHPALPFVERRINPIDRRKPTLRSFFQGGLMPRRRDGRRATDRYFPIDWHDPYLLIVAIVMLTLSVCDALFTIKLLANGAYESNVLLAFVLNEHPRLFAAVKMGLTGFGIVVLIALTRSRLLGIISGRTLFQILTIAYLSLVAYEFWLLQLII